MATKNFEAGDDFVLIANEADDALLISSETLAHVEFVATVANDTTPTVRGHVLEVGVGKDAFVPRQYGVEGYIQARKRGGGPPVTLAVDGSTVGD